MHRLIKHVGGIAGARNLEIHDRATTFSAGEAADRKFEQLAIQEAHRSVPENDGRVPSKGRAVVVKNGQVLGTAHRGEHKGNHAEYIALEKKLPNIALAGATVYTTLEPCTTRNHPKIPCADRLIERKIKRVVIGMLDPDPRITGRGLRKLRSANIITDLFPHDLMTEIEELNRNFTRILEVGATHPTEKRQPRGRKGKVRRAWPKQMGVYVATSSAAIPSFPRIMSGYRSEPGMDFWNKPFISKGTLRVFKGHDWVGLKGFPNTMNGCSTGIFMFRWRLSDPTVRVETSAGFSDAVTSRPKKIGSFGYMSGTNCEQPMFKFADTVAGNEATLVDVYYELKFWQAAP